MKNEKKTIITGLAVMSVMLSVLATYNVAFAQESDDSSFTTLHATGALVDQANNNGHRSTLWLGFEKDPANTEEDSDSDYEVNRATLVLRKYDDSKVFSFHIFSVVPDSWTMTVNSDNTEFEATGEVHTGDGIVYDLEINGEFMSEMENGNLYLINGTFSGDDETYDIFFISVMQDG